MESLTTRHRLGQALQAENGKLWAVLESQQTAQQAKATNQEGRAMATPELLEQHTAMSQRLESVMRERADVAARLSAAQVWPCPAAFFH
jgi:hypothetical protein